MNFTVIITTFIICYTILKLYRKEKTIKISNQEYVIKSSAYTMFAYKDFTGRDLLNDVQSLKNMYYEINKLPTKE